MSAGVPKKCICTRIIKFIENCERVSLRALEAADKISFRLILYVLAVLEAYRYLSGKH